MLTEWQDQRSGPAGCIVGNVVLEEIQGKGEVFKRLKGTVFISDSRLVIGRMCTTETYLTSDWIHFCNLTKGHHRSMKQAAGNRSVEYLFITVRDNEIHYWTIPHRVVSRILARASVKKSDSASILRIKAHNGKYLMMGRDVTMFHKVFLLHPGLIRKISRANKKAKQPKPTVKEVKPKGDKQEFTIEYDGKVFQGTLPAVTS